MNSLLINIDVPDLSKATQFYMDAFELKVGRRFESARIVELLGLPSPIFLLEKNEGSTPFPGAKSGRGFQRHWTPVHLDIIVESIEHAVERARTAGATTESGVRKASWGRIAICSDPFGHGFCLIEFIGRGYDELLS